MRVNRSGGKGAVFAAILMFVCLVAGSASAENENLEEGIRLYEALEYEPAQAKLQAALTEEDATREEISRAALYLGVVSVALGDAAAGETWFTVALAYDDSLQVPQGTSPKIAEQFNALAARLKFTLSVAEPAVETAKEVLAEVPVEPIVEPPPPAPAPVVEDRGRMWTWVAAGSTVAAAGAAVTFALLARSTASDIESEPHERATLEELQDKLDTRGDVANIFVAVTGALAVSTAIVYFAERPTKKTAREMPSISVAGSRDGAWVGARFSF
jgi:hypothetical protein